MPVTSIQAGRITITEIPCTYDKAGVSRIKPHVFKHVLSILMKRASYGPNVPLSISYIEESQWQPLSNPHKKEINYVC